jgi:hypothetical protein
MRPSAALLALPLFAIGCDSNQDAPTETSARSASAAVTAAPSASEKRLFSVMPDMLVDEGGIHIGPEHIDLGKADGAAKLAETAERIAIDGKQVTLRTSQKAALRDVAAVVTALAKRGAPSISLQMAGGRKDLPGEFVIVPEGRIATADDCSVVATVLEDLSTGAWTFKGGFGKKARKSPFSGPDLSMTGENVASLLKACSSKTAFFSAHAALRWEHAFHIGALIRKTDADGKIDKLVFLSEEPVAGRPVKLRQ